MIKQQVLVKHLKKMMMSDGYTQPVFFLNVLFIKRGRGELRTLYSAAVLRD